MKITSDRKVANSWKRIYDCSFLIIVTKLPKRYLQPILSTFVQFYSPSTYKVQELVHISHNQDLNVVNGIFTAVLNLNPHIFNLFLDSQKKIKISSLISSLHHSSRLYFTMVFKFSNLPRLEKNSFLLQYD